MLALRCAIRRSINCWEDERRFFLEPEASDTHLTTQLLLAKRMWTLRQQRVGCQVILLGGKVLYPYKITATLTKAGGTPIAWTHFSKTKLTRQQCEKLLSTAMVIGLSAEVCVTVTDFQCVQVCADNVIVNAP